MQDVSLEAQPVGSDAAVMEESICSLSSADRQPQMHVCAT
jgi:hypothetical protein